MASSKAITSEGASPEEMKPLRNGRGQSRQVVRPDSNESGLTVNIVRVKGDSEPGPYHYHDGAATFYLVLEGRVRFIVDGEVIDAEPQEGCFMERGIPHATHNVGDEDATILLVFDRSTEGDFVEVPLPNTEVYERAWKADRNG